MGVLCDGADAVDLSASCVREFWGLLLPAVVLFILLTAATPKPGFARRLLRPITAPFANYLSYQQAEALDSTSEERVLLETPRPPLWRTLVLAGLSLAESLAWLFVGSLEIFQALNPVFVARAYVSALSWLYATVRLVARPAVTAPLDIFALLLVHLAAETLQLGGLAYDNAIDGIPLPARAVMAAHVLNLVVVLLLLVVVLSIPTGVPTSRIDKTKIGQEVIPEDFATLWQWCTFSWVYPLVKKGTHATLNDSDVWNLGPTIRARPVYIKFATILRSSLIRRIWAANSLDLMIDFIGCYISVLFNYAAPYFLRRILDAIDDPTPAKRAQAYIFTLLAFVCQVIKTEADLQHLWYGRRASTRIRIELMSAIYDKALKRRDFSGVISAEQKDAAQDASDKRKGKEAKERKGTDDPRSGADIGKIVNLMAADANRTAMTISAMYFLYSAPFELVLGSVFLYRLLGWSAFAGFGVLVAAWPLNKFVTERSVRIQKGVMAARDKRMGVLNELIGAVKLIKFFAWEERWIGRALDAREKEMKWLIKARLNSVMFHALWSLAPVLVSTVSFAVYVALGNELTVATAFTAIALFQMIRVPLNVLPTWVVQLLQTKVAIDRMTKFLSEDEVDGQVCSLKPTPAHIAEVYDVLGIEKGAFKWNEVDEKEDEDKKGKGKQIHTPEPSDATIIPADAADADRASLTSDTTSQRFELRDITLRFPEGKLSVVTGPTASGKSALLLALLGEMTQLDGTLLMHKDPSRVGADGLSHTIAYAAQAPWLRHQSIRANILFGSPVDEVRYDAVLDACALRPDLEVLEDGDNTEIGARGVSLSGGQKARVALARAVYARSRYVLLDDPLSAVDSHTARALFENLLMGPLLAGRTVVLVTHHVDLVLPGAHYLVRMLDGRIDTQGTVADLRAQGVLESIASAEAPEVAKEEQAVAKEEDEKTPEEAAVEGEGDGGAGEAKKGKKPRKLVKDEERQAGAVKWNIYKTYLQASSYWTWAILAFFIICVQGLVIIEKVWIKTWGESYGEVHTNSMSASTGFTSLAVQHVDGPSAGLIIPHSVHDFHGYGHQASTTTLPSARQHPLFYVGIFALIGVASMLTSVLTIITQYTGALRASRQLFGRLLRTVVCATMRWHDGTPLGRILNRFSKDIETVDSSLASSLQAVNTSMASFLASILTIAFIFPVFLVPAAALGAVYYYLAIGYLNTGRDLRRMESNARSPIFSGFGEMLEGIVTVRAFSAERPFLDDLFVRIDSMTKMWYNFWMTNRWLLLNFDLLGAFAVGLTTFLALSGFVSAGIAGICITSAMAFTNSIYWTCRFWTSLELDLNSVERVVEYLDLPQEPPMLIEDSRPPTTWPARDSQNLIVVDGLTVKYAPELPSVLHNISFALRGNERIGLLGRTGSGKSTLAMSILRFVDPSEGRIIIDGVDITSIGLHDLRARITYIPQEAVLFSGTLRENLDPFDEHDDIECLDALHRVQMLTDASYNSQKASRQASRAPTRPASPSASSSVTDHAAEASLASATDIDSKAPVTLDTQISPGGTNFSQGQRQLIAMARALLRRSAIVVLDEATSSIDYATDAKIQAAIRAEFGGALLLTVAHRLRTIIDYDRLIVLDKGQVAEFDTPWELIQRENGIFRGMCLKSGSYAELEQAAKEKAGA